MKQLLVLVLLCSATSHAETDEQRRARDELDRQLQQMVGKTPTRVKVELVNVDDPNYVLEDATFELDGVPLKAPTPAMLAAQDTAPVWQGDVKAGKHTLAVHLVYANRASVVMSDEGGFKWKLAATVSFDVYSGIEVQVKAVPSRDAAQRDVAKRFKLSLPAAPVMVAKLDDGKMPEPVRPPPPPMPALADAGIVVDAKQKAKDEAEAKRVAAAEVLKAKAEAARAAREEAQRKAKEDAEARRLAKEEAQRKAKEEAEVRAEAKRAAKEEAQRKAAEAIRAPKEEPQRPLAEESKRVDAGVALAKVADAGVSAPVAVVDSGPAPSTVVAVLEVVDAGLAPQAALEVPDDGPGWLVWAGGGLGAALVLLVVIARRRASVPRIDD